MSAAIPYAVLTAQPDPLRAESLNYGLVAFGSTGPVVRVDDAAVRRLRALHPNYANWDAAQEQASITAALARGATTEQQQQLLGMLCATAHGTSGTIFIHEGEDTAKALSQQLDALMARLVHPPARTIAAPRKASTRPTSKLAKELKDWLRRSKAFSSNLADLSKGRVVANYPVSADQDLYCDFAVKNGHLHVLETLDFKGHDRVTSSLRGEAAVKGITLDEARTITGEGRRIAIVRAEDYGMARGTINMVGRYASDVFVMDVPEDRQRLADFFHTALHRTDLQDLPA